MIPLSHPSVHPSIVDQYSCSVAESPHWQQRSAGGDIWKRSSESRINCGEWRDWKEEWGMEGGVRLGWKVKVREKKRVRQVRKVSTRSGSKDTRWRKEKQSGVLRKEMKVVVAEGDWMVALWSHLRLNKDVLFCFVRPTTPFCPFTLQGREIENR